MYCKMCNTGVIVEGICNNCGFLRPCSYCGGLILDDNSVYMKPYVTPENASHGICKKCFHKELKKLEKKFLEKKEMEAL